MGKQLSILEITELQLSEAKERRSSGKMYHSDIEAQDKELLKPIKEKKQMAKQEAKETTIEGVQELCDTFDPTNANKKQIREFRKALGELSKEKYPKKAKKAKEPKKATKK